MRCRWQCETTRRRVMGWQAWEPPSWRFAIQAISIRGNLGLGALQCSIGLALSLAPERVFPELASHLERIDAGRLPPGALVAYAMNGTMMGAAERHRELIACLAAQRTGLHEPQVMGVRRLAAAEKARLADDEPEVLLVAVATGDTDREHAFVDPSGLMRVGAITRASLLRAGSWPRRSIGAGHWRGGFSGQEAGQLLLERILQHFCVGGRQAVLAGEGFAGPARCTVLRRKAGNLAQKTVA